MRTITIRLTPALATHLLNKNTNNRPKSDKGLSRLVSDIKAGRWETTHQSIAFSVAGDVVDGQHRLIACADAGVDIIIRVTYFTNTDVAVAIEAAECADPDDIRVGGPVDGGILRTAAATLSIRHGGNNWRRIGAHVRALELVRANQGQLGDLVGPKARDDNGDEAKRPNVCNVLLSEARIESVYSDYRSEIDWSCEAFTGKTSASIAFPIALWMPIYPKEMAALAHQVRTGANLPEKHPALVLRALDNSHKTRVSRELIAHFLKSSSLARSACIGQGRSMVRASHEAWADLSEARRKAGLK